MKKFVFVLVLIFGVILHAKQKTELVCSAATYLVRAHPRRGYIRSDGTHVGASHVNAYCKARTAVSDTWSSRFSSKAPDGWSKKEKPKPWTDEERERVIESLEELPDFLTAQEMKEIIRFKTSKDGTANPASESSIGYIALYDNAFSTKQNLSRVLAHELAHVLYDRFPYRTNESYRTATGWIYSFEGRTAYLTRRKSGYVEEDGFNSAQEDFANNVEYYLFDREKLKKVTPAAYEWLRKTFGDKLELRSHK